MIARSRRFVWTAVLSLATVVAAATAPLAIPSPAQAETTLRVGNVSFGPRKGQIHWAFAAADVMPLMAFFDSLTYVDETGKLLPGLATKWEAKGNNTWIFTLRPNAKFHNGKPMDAAALVANIDYLLTDEGKTTSGGRMLTDFIVAAKALDGQMVEVKTKIAAPILDRWVALLRPMETGHFKDVGPDGFGVRPVGTGSFKVNSWTPEGIRGEAFADAWRKPKADKIVINELPENAARLQALTSGQIDIAWTLTPDDAASIRNAGGTVHVSPVGDIMTLGFNIIKDGPFKDARVRQALSYGVNREAFIQGVLGGLTKPASHPAASNVSGFQQQIKPYPYDPTKAKAMLAQAGFPNGLKAKVEMITSGDFAVAFQNVANDLSKIGVELELINLTIPEFIQRFVGQKPWDGNAISTIYEPYPTGDVMRTLVTQSCTGRGNFICDRTIQPKIDAANLELDPAKRGALVTEVMQYYHDQALGLFLYEAIQVTGLSKTVKNYRFANRTPNYHEIEVTP